MIRAGQSSVKETEVFENHRKSPLTLKLHEPCKKNCFYVFLQRCPYISNETQKFLKVSHQIFRQTQL